MARTPVRWRSVLAFVGVSCATVYVLGGRAGAAGGGPSGQARQHVYVVQPGDTVWSIAQRSVGPAADPRPLVDELIRINGLLHRLLVPGDRVVLPADALGHSRS
ncbi:MAG TPA: LysM peptidoglycan-binding domain-containing protein [Actinomycetota bacterium]|nr:LysM peptidoglycan-binding domain-containing protein [Actinomycetota bacterium]